MFKKLAVFMVLATGSALAGTLSISGPISGEQGFATMNDAAVAALTRSVAISQKVEEGGGIYELNGKFYYTMPETKHSDNELDLILAFPQDAKLVGLFHTHPPSENNAFFSVGDVDVAMHLKVASYIGVVAGKDSEIIRYVPGNVRRPWIYGYIADGQFISKLKI